MFFKKRLNYDAKEISQNCENIHGDKTHQNPGGHILPHTMEWSQVWSQIQLNFLTAP